MSVGAGSAGGGIGSGVVLQFFWNAWASRRGWPQMDAGTAGAVAILLVPVIAYVGSWLPQPKVSERRG